MENHEILITDANEDESCSCSNAVQVLEISRLLFLEDNNTPSYAIIVLNRPISHNQAYLVNLWRNARVTLTADGGTDRWDTFLDGLDGETQLSLRPPDLITGDFDSISNHVLEKYRSRGSEIIHTPDQNATDFTKAIMEINSYCKQRKMVLDAVIVISETSGRMDQFMANINTLFLCREKKLLDATIYLMSDDSISWLLEAGDHTIAIPERIRLARSWCALIPVGEPCKSVTTAGLKWNLKNQVMKFGGMVSTSNTYDGSPTIRIQCSHTLLFSMKIKTIFA